MYVTTQLKVEGKKIKYKLLFFKSTFFHDRTSTLVSITLQFWEITRHLILNSRLKKPHKVNLLLGAQIVMQDGKQSEVFCESFISIGLMG